MTDQTEDSKKNLASGASAGDLDNHSQSKLANRRGFLQKSAAATVPLAMVSLSKPAWGTYGNRLCWSGMHSGNVSGEITMSCVCGRSPGYYKNNVTKTDGGGWPTEFRDYNGHGCDGYLKSNGTIEKECKNIMKYSAPGVVPGDTFTDTFGCTPSDVGARTLMQTLWQLPGSFWFHAVANLFNAIKLAPNYAFSPEQVKAITCFFAASPGALYDGITKEQMKDIFASQYCEGEPPDHHGDGEIEPPECPAEPDCSFDCPTQIGKEQTKDCYIHVKQYCVDATKKTVECSLEGDVNQCSLSGGSPATHMGNGNYKVQVRNNNYTGQPKTARLKCVVDGYTSRSGYITLEKN